MPADVMESKTATELRREWEQAEKALTSTQEQLKYLYDGMKTAEGNWQTSELQAKQLAMLEAQSTQQTNTVNAIKLEFSRVTNEENLNRRRSEPAGGVALFPPAGTSSGPDNPTLGATAASVKSLPGSLTDAFTESRAFKSWQHGATGQTASMEIPVNGGVRGYAMKATLTTSTGPFTGIDKYPTVIQLGQQMLTIADLYSQGTTSLPTVRYIQEDSFTNAAAMVAEDGTKPEFTWDLSEVDAVVRKVAGITKASDESLKDFPMLRTYIDDRLPFAIRQREELQLISGDGTGQNLLGILNVPGILTQAFDTNNINTLYKGITKVRSQGFFEPDAVVIHPDNWAAIRLLQTTTGEYEFGHPAIAGPETIFGKRVVITANCPAGSAVVGAFKIGGTIVYREGLRVEATNTDQDDFVKNRITIRAEQREVPLYWRPKAFAKCTGLSS